jgi:hypothetical protein
MAMSGSYSLQKQNVKKPGMPALDLHQQKSQPDHIATARMIERMAIELRARSGGELPHSFYVEKVKQRMRDKGETVIASDPLSPRMKPEIPSVFHAWALRE